MARGLNNIPIMPLISTNYFRLIMTANPARITMGKRQ
jgi:hypothetical protein